MHKPLNSERDKFEYYTSEDEFGLPVNKLRKKGAKPKAKPTKKAKSKDKEDPDLEFYSTYDKDGKKVQKLRKKNSKSQGRLGQSKDAKNNFNFRPDFKEVDQSTIKGSVMGASGENFAKFSALSSRGNLTSAHDALTKQRSRSNNQPLQPAISARPPTDHGQDRIPNQDVMSHLNTHRPTAAVDRAAIGTAERNA